jgi:AAA+ superfamily predicted ATPase
MFLDGKQYTLTEKGPISHERQERVMVDYDGMIKYANQPFDMILDSIIEYENLKEEDKLIILPFACIYNLGINKYWGMTHIKSLHEIDYKKDAFDFLVLENKKKSLIKSLISSRTLSKYKDFIESKGNGLVFLLFGPPGTGKSLTAEATCEFLSKPLYNINVGDLGTDPENMEVILNRIIELSNRWDAVIVIDEVDIFLEERESNMIARNAMVGVFLKILEYHDGIIFLTTNRLQSLDPAVKSRINLMLSYKELGSDQRTQIWTSLFKKWSINIKKQTITKLANYKLNGREIRNYMKIVLSIHEQDNKVLSDKSFMVELENCFAITEEFTQQIKSTLYA